MSDIHVFNNDWAESIIRGIVEMSNQATFNLLELPREILTQIIDYFLATQPGTQIPLLDRRRRRRVPNPSQGTSISAWQANSSVFRDPSHIVPILLIHPIIYALSIPILYGPQQVFTLDLTGSKHSHARSVFAQAASSTYNDQHLAPENRNILRNWFFLRNISSVKITLDRLRGWTADHIVPLALRMILSGSLKHLHIHLDTSTENDSWNFSLFEKLKEGAPLRAFMDLLADPDLSSAKLTVSDVHDGSWCTFHKDETRRSVNDCRQRMRVTGAEGIERWQREVDIEWWRLSEEAEQKVAVESVIEK